MIDVISYIGVFPTVTSIWCEKDHAKMLHKYNKCNENRMNHIVKINLDI